jgi:hypothetical protein
MVTKAGVVPRKVSDPVLSRICLALGGTSLSLGRAEVYAEPLLSYLQLPDIWLATILYLGQFGHSGVIAKVPYLLELGFDADNGTTVYIGLILFYNAMCLSD